MAKKKMSTGGVPGRKVRTSTEKPSSVKHGMTKAPQGAPITRMHA